MADIFSEVEEELRRDKYNALLRRYGPWVLGAVFLIVLGTGLYTMVWEPMRDARIHQASDAYAEAVALRDAGNTLQAEAAFGVLADGDHRGYAVLATLQQAHMAVQAGDADRAAALYSEAAEMADDEAVAGLARIRALYLVADEASYDEILTRAEPLTGAESPYRASARELIAAAALRAGDLDRAEREYEYLALAPETPPGLRTRAEEGLAAVERARELEPSQSAEDSPS